MANSLTRNKWQKQYDLVMEDPPKNEDFSSFEVLKKAFKEDNNPSKNNIWKTKFRRHSLNEDDQLESNGPLNLSQRSSRRENSKNTEGDPQTLILKEVKKYFKEKPTFHNGQNSQVNKVIENQDSLREERVVKDLKKFFKENPSFSNGQKSLPSKDNYEEDNDIENQESLFEETFVKETEYSQPLTISSSILETEAHRFTEDELLEDSNQNEELIEKFNPLATFMKTKLNFNNQDKVFSENDLNFIILFGFFLGIFISKAMKYFQLYSMWTLQQILNLHVLILGSFSLWEFFTTNNPKHFNATSRLLLLPFIVIGCIVYFILFALNRTARMLLTPVPRRVSQIIKKIF